jgi:membrane associated rhomboid family serine protease
MLILGDDGHYHGRFPWVTAALVVVNVLVFVAQAFIGEPFTNGFSLVPEEITTFRDLTGTKYLKAKVLTDGHFDGNGQYQPPRLEDKNIPIKHYTGPFPIFLTLLTSMFMHGGVFHLIGNMWFLLVFGRNVECAMNHGRFLAFYTACGVFAGLAHVASEPHSIIPCLGASGAISGVLGAYVSIHPLNKVKCWFGWWIGIIEIPALVVIGVWFILQYFSAFLAMEDASLNDGVAYWAHLGGFAAGFIIIRGVIIYLRRQQAEGALGEDEPLAATDEETFGSAPPIANVPKPVVQTGIAAGAPDPFATFLSVQTVRKVQDAKPQESVGSK